MTPVYSRFPLLILFALSVTLLSSCLTGQTTQSKEEIIAAGAQMADAQLPLLSKSPQKLIDWVPAVMWSGYSQFSHLPGQEKYQSEIQKVGDAVQWSPLYRRSNPYHADDYCIGQSFLDTYAGSHDPAQLAPIKSRCDEFCNAMDKNIVAPDPVGKNTIIWFWCDTLYMAPAVLAQLSQLTRDPKYLQAMDKAWMQTYDLLYDKDEHLFFRDKRFFDKKTKNGKKVFWSRGNGWVFAGLARTLTYLPADSPLRDHYIATYKEMAVKLASLQGEDGAWRSSLLDADEFPSPEMSGTALDCYAYAWGINHGILDRATYLPIAEKAWAILLAARRTDGVLAYIQGVGDRPAAFNRNGTQLYSTGAFLLSAVELSKLAPLQLPKVSALPVQTPPSPTSSLPASSQNIPSTPAKPLQVTMETQNYPRVKTP